MYEPNLQSVFDSTMAVMPIAMRRFEKGLRVDLPVAREERTRLLAEIASQEKGWQKDVLDRAPERQDRIVEWRKKADEEDAAAQALIDQRAKLNAVFAEQGKKKRLAPTPMAARTLLGKAKKLRAQADKEENVSFRSPQQLSKLLYQDLKLPVHVKRGTGLVTTDEEALMDMISMTNDPALRAILEMRRKHKVAKTFFGEKMIGEGSGGKIHFHTVLTRNNEQWKKSGACTGRHATKPSVQVMPEELRHVWLPDQEDHVIVGADWSSAEIYAIAWMTGQVTGDHQLWRFVSQGGDIYRRFASHDLGIPEADVTKAQRKGYKRRALGLNYGLGPKKAASMWGCTMKEAKQATASYLESMWGLAEFREWSVKTAADEGKLVNPFGRVRYFPDDTFHGEALNFYPQTIVADMLNATIRSLDDRLGQADLDYVLADQALWLHDAIYISCASHLAQGVGQILSFHMTKDWDPWMPGFQVPAEVKIGRCMREFDLSRGEWNGLDLVPVERWEEAA